MPQLPHRTDAAQTTEATGQRARLLVAWGNAVIRGHVSPDTAADRVVAGELVHRVLGLSAALGRPAEEPPVSLPLFLARLRALGVTGLHLALPVPGDVSGLPGPPEFNVEAVGAGAAVVAVGRPLALIPYAVGAGVEWRVHAVARDAAAAGCTPLADADRALRSALTDATAALAALDVARWRPEIAPALAALREAPRDDVLAPGYPARAVALAALAGRLRRVAGLALQDCGAAVSAAEMALRAEPLLALATACRRADVAAHNAPDDRDGGSAAPPGRLRR